MANVLGIIQYISYNLFNFSMSFVAVVYAVKRLKEKNKR